ncbi:hypothetical protein PZA11_004907 [Diplocarpon coronariae]
MAEESNDQGDTKTSGEEEESRDKGETSDEEGTADESDEDSGDEDDDEEEPKLKYARLTSHLAPVYRNGDATSSFMVAGDKMSAKHVLSLPTFQPLRAYRAHTASTSSISISPFPLPRASAVPEAVTRIASQGQTPKRAPSMTSEASAAMPRTPRIPHVISNTPSNAIYIATSSIDGNVCVQSLVDVKDVQLRNFGRPVQAVAISPDYKNDRTYVSGGLAGNLVLTVAAATASGWLGAIGIGGNTGKDTVLHSGEGTISTIKWSLSGKYVVWINEHGVKIMRTHLHLESADLESAWKRIGHVDRPQDNGWEEMAGVWKGRAEWIDEKSLENDEDDKARENSVSSPATAKLRQQGSSNGQRIEKLVVGWGGTVWIINVHPGGVGIGKHIGERSVGKPEIIKILRMDCIISGLSLYTPTLLVVLAYITPDENKDEAPKGHKSKTSPASSSSEPRGGIRRRQNAKSPELRLIDLNSSQEVDTDTLTVSRFERLSATDYHLGVLPAARAITVAPSSRGTLEALAGMGSGMWNATISATTLLNSGASTRSSGSKESETKQSVASSSRGKPGQQSPSTHPHIAAPGMKIFIHSPYDCILSTKRDLSDHLSWLLEHGKNQEAWVLIDEHPEVISAKLINSSVEKEKRRIGELWIQELIKAGDWVTAGRVCGRVLGTAQQWEEYVYTFVGAGKFDEITNYIPTIQMHPPLKSEIFEVILGHYAARNRPRIRELLDQWPLDLFDIKSVTTVLENQLKYRDVREDSVEDGEVGRDWRIVMESLGKLHVAAGRLREALKCYIKLQDADTAMALIREYHLVDAVADNIPGLIMLRVSKEQKRSASIAELRELTSEAITLLVDEAQHGLVSPQVVVDQLQQKKMPLYLYFYVSSLWRGDGIEEHQGETRERLVSESKSLVDDLADLAVHLFALYDRDLLMDFLKSSTYYSFETATQECKDRDFIPELVYLYSKTGQPKRALYLIIERLRDVSQAISFCKAQDDIDLWDTLLDYSMDKPRFICGLLEEVGTAIDPITLVRRIPEGLEIEGLREGLSRMIKEYEIQYSISTGVARVLRGEVALAQTTLRSGQRKGVKFDVVHKANDHLDVEASDVPTKTAGAAVSEVARDFTENATTPAPPEPGHCVGCHESFSDHETETMVGFACGHVFHLSHLLSFREERPETPPEVELDENGDWKEGNTHSVGAKVTHARLLRDKIRDGCPVCFRG